MKRGFLQQESSDPLMLCVSSCRPQEIDLVLPFSGFGNAYWCPRLFCYGLCSKAQWCFEFFGSDLRQLST